MSIASKSIVPTGRSCGRGECTMPLRARGLVALFCFLSSYSSAFFRYPKAACPLVPSIWISRLPHPQQKRPSLKRPSRLVARSSGQEASESLEKIRQRNQKTHEEVWASRRAMARATLSAAQAFRAVREFVTGDQVEDSAEGDGTGSLAADGRGALVISATVLAIAAATLRIGGRAALVSLLGLDFTDDVDMKNTVESFLAFVEGLGPLRYAYFLGAWVVAKTFCLDFLSVVLALSSGIIFGGVVEGALLSAACATLASGVGFQLSRTVLRGKVIEQLEKRPALRALDKVVSEEGFKTVVTLRLAPVLPIPLGAYNYAYGASTLPVPAFLAGTFLGSIKPYLLDSYLGVFGKSIVDGGGGPGGDLALVGTFFVVVLVGTFASQVATRTWDELSAEAKAATVDRPPDRSDVASEGVSDDGLEWLSLWGIERSSLPGFYTAWQEADLATKRKIRRVVEQEWVYMRDRLACADRRERGDGGADLPVDPRFPAPGAPLLNKDGRTFDMSAYISESTAFPFVLVESFWKYSNPRDVSVDGEAVESLPLDAEAEGRGAYKKSVR